MIEYLDREHLDIARWDERVRQADGFKHYYLSYYLDHAAEKWAAVVCDDYEWVWPLPYKSNIVKWVYQPLLCQQLGPIGRTLSADEWTEAISIINGYFSWFNVKFNDTLNTLPLPNQETHRNIELDLSPSYEMLFKAYKRNIRSNLKKFERSGALVKEDASYRSWAVEGFQATKGCDFPELDDSFYRQVEAIYRAFLSRSRAKTYLAVYEGELVAQLLLLEAEHRSLVFFTHASDAAREIGAMHALIDHAIKERAGRPGALLDFEGSDNDNLAYFYQSFGGEERVYLQAGTKSILHTLKDRLIP